MPRALRVALLLVIALAGVLVAIATATAATTHGCPSHQYWDNINVHGMTCHQAVQVHREKLRECLHPHRRVTRTAYVYTCSFGPWRSTERVARHRFGDRVYISRDSGRVWMRYDALP